MSKENANATMESETFNRKQFMNDCKKMKAILDKEPKKTIRLPLLKDKNAMNYVPVCINGYIYQVKRGEVVEVPAPVATLLEEAGYLDA
jgi:hypothetical protein